jgi:hypothetical protein
MKTRNTIIVTVIGVLALVAAPSRASEILTCKYAGWLEVVTSENKVTLEKEGFVPFPIDPRVMFKSQSHPKSFQISKDAMHWGGKYYESYTKTNDGEDLVVAFDSEFRHFRGWNATYAAELDRLIVSTGPCWW